MNFDDEKLPKVNDSFKGWMKMMDSFFNESLISFDHFFNNASFAVDMYETDTDVVIEAKLQGYQRDQIEVECLGNGFRISAIKLEVNELTNDVDSFYQKNEAVQKIERVISLPFIVSENDTHASFQDGVLRIVTPKKRIRKRLIDID
ncbi:MAG TPA: Hsp20/alpha crystallin family protein [Chondromyces sp.]|nr:Hsp20/alpha crystallin family protein [Chondromyces sp.]